ncbi:glycosyl transferase [Pseudoroseicyclus aestuarii]|uniref:Glycosyl transferase-like sugar-binding protein n=1 Tax=Pseudoroseicyclus aestuarii TaxID=1795041 RepID=A0A318SPK4_9RHOB|nr:glycosyl transferase [Pseudoroseicyclus aestuarii]PYE82268.1 hypothetical protein DFP88_10420 [Pseudoroseicyclus aestuarii]
MTQDVKQVICINWGTRYGAPWINRLYGMVARNITGPFTFTCFTDTAEGVRPEVLCEDLPQVDFPMPVGTKGKWPKSRLWGPRLGSLSGPVLFLDLDVLVTGSLDPFFDFGGPEDVVLSRNPNTPFERLGQTSCFRFPVGKLVPMQEAYAADPQGIAERYEFEQRFVTRNAPGGIKLFPARWVRHFRQHCRRPFPLNYALAPKLPRDARLVIFPGGFHPRHAIAGHYPHREPGSPGQHLRRLFDKDRPDPPLRHLRHYLRPAPWVEEVWRE